MATAGDTFVEGGANVALSSHTPTGANAGSGWTTEEMTGSRFWRVNASADVAEADGVEGDDNIISTLQPNPSTQDVDVSATMNNVTSGGDPRPFYLVARYQDASNYYAAGVYRAAAANDAKMWKKVAGTVTELASGDTGIAVSDVLKFELRGSTLKLYKNGGEILSATDGAITAAGKAGIGMGNGLVATDDIGAWAISAFSHVEVTGGGTGTLTATLGALVASAAGAVAIAGTLSATLSALVLAGAGTGTVAVTGDATTTLGALTVSAAGTVDLVGSLAFLEAAYRAPNLTAAHRTGPAAATHRAPSLSRTHRLLSLEATYRGEPDDATYRAGE